MISPCESETYVLVNQPGLLKADFKNRKKSMGLLHKYVETSSTALGFENVEISEHDDLFEDIIDYAMQKCDINDRIDLAGDPENRYDPYVEAHKRIIRVDFPPLPRTDYIFDGNLSRREVLKANDEYLRYIVGTLPSPQHTVIYTSLEASDPIENEENEGTLTIWSEIFEDAWHQLEIDRNDRVSKELPTFVPYRPMIDTAEDLKLSVLDKDFIQKNYGTLVSIAAVSAVFLLYQIGLVLFKSPAISQKPKKVDKKVATEKKTQ